MLVLFVFEFVFEGIFIRCVLNIPLGALRCGRDLDKAFLLTICDTYGVMYPHFRFGFSCFSSVSFPLYYIEVCKWLRRYSSFQ